MALYIPYKHLRVFVCLCVCVCLALFSDCVCVCACVAMCKNDQECICTPDHMRNIEEL